MTQRSGNQQRSSIVVVFLSCLALALAACAPEAATEYSTDTDENFFAACTDPTADPDLQTRLCQCIYQRIQIAVPYERLSVLDDELVFDPELQLAPELVEVLAACVIQEGELQS